MYGVQQAHGTVDSKSQRDNAGYSLTIPKFLQKVPPSMNWLYLTVAIVCEVIATSALKSSEGFSRLLPSGLVVVGYCAAFYFLSLTLRTIPVGIAYAVWAGAGVVLITLVGWVVFKQELDAPAFLGIGLIASGVVVLNVFSKSTAH
jgi:small multidrug resistance pump